MVEESRIPPFDDLEETCGSDVGRDFTQVALGFCVPSVHHEFRVEIDAIEGTLLAPFPPSFRDERRGPEVGMWEVVDDLVDDFLGK